jgi:hypothetical protein
VERVHRAHRVRGALGDDVGDPLRAVGADVGEPVGALFAEGVEEGPQDVLAVAVGHPHEVPGVVVDHDRHVLLPLAVAAGQNRADSAPGNPHQPRGRGLGALGGQSGDLLVEVVGVPDVVPGPGHRGDHDPVPTTGLTRGASASRNSGNPAASRCRHRLRPAPASKRAQRVSQIPHRRRTRDFGRTATAMTCASSSNQASSGTACSHPTNRFNTVVNRTPFLRHIRSRA